MNKEVTDFLGRWNVDSNFVLELRKKLPMATEANNGKFVVVNIGGVHRTNKYVKGSIVTSNGVFWHELNEEFYTEEMKKLKITMINDAWKKAFGDPDDNFALKSR